MNVSTAERPAIGRLRRRVSAPGAWPVGVWLLLALGLSLLVRVPFLGLPMISDEGGYAYVAKRWLAGEGRLYHDLWVSRPQGIFVAYGLIFETLGTGVAALRLGAGLTAAATLLIVWRVAGALGGGVVAVVAALLFALLAGSPAIEGFTANAEVFMALPAAGAAWLLLRAGRGGWGRAPLLGTGALAGVATLLKPSGVVMLGVGLAFVWLLAADGRRALRREGWLLAGFAAALAPALIHGWWLGWDAFVFAAVTYRLTSQSGATAGLGHQAVSIAMLLVRCWPLLALAGLAAVAGRGGLPRPLLGRGAAPRRLTGAGRLGIVSWGGLRWGTLEPGRTLLGLWLLASLAGVAVGGDWWPHYLIQVAAPFAIWLAGLLVGAWARLATAQRRGLATLAIVALLSPYGVAARGSADAISLAVFGQPNYPSQDEVAAYLRQHAPADATIFVGYDNPAIYYLADRPAAYRYLYDAELKAIPGSYGDLLQLIAGPDRPRYVVGTTERAPYPDNGKAFWAAVLRHYHMVDRVHGVPIMRENDGLGRGR